MLLAGLPLRERGVNLTLYLANTLTEHAVSYANIGIIDVLGGVYFAHWRGDKHRLRFSTEPGLCTILRDFKQCAAEYIYR